MVAAPIRPTQQTALSAMLDSMNTAPGRVDPGNTVLPFGRYDRLHVARFVILQDETLGDLAAYGTSFPNAPVWLVFLGDCDGAADDMLRDFATTAETGLRSIFEQRKPQFVSTVAEKLLAYALGRPTQYYDRPAVRAITRGAMPDYKWSSLILGIVRSQPFQMRRAES